MRDTLAPAGVVVGLALTLLGVSATIASFWIPAESDGSLGARVFPLAGALSLTLLGVLDLIATIKGSVVLREQQGEHTGRVLILFLVALGYVWLISKFGYLAATAPVVLVVMWLFGVRNKSGLLTAAILCPAIYHLIFFTGLGVFPPFGEWFDLLDVVSGN